MKKLAIALSTASLVVTGIAVPTSADARRHYYHGRVYHGGCRRSSGTTGLIAGGAGGALVGNALGKHLDKRHDAAQNRRNGC